MAQPLDPEHPGRFSSSLVAGLSMLACFSSERPVQGIADMAEQLDLGRSTTHRYATTLAALGYLEQSTARKYGLAARVSDIGLSLLDSMVVRRVAREHLRQLRAQTGHTVRLGILDQSEVVYVDRWQGSRQGQYAIDVGIGPGTRQPVYCTTAGKAILARLPAAEQNELTTKLKLRRRGPKTHTSKVALRAELEGIATEGDIAAEDQELLVGRLAVAGAVLDSTGQPVAAVELAVPAAALSLNALVANLGPLVLDVVGRISLALRQSHDQPSPPATN